MRIGFFGKLPSRGDFLRIGVSREVAGAWDGWLQAVMPAAQAALGEDWAPAWRAAPAWRFVLAAGVCSSRPVSGLFLPSNDNVGRLFPLLVTAEPAGLSGAFLDAAEPAVLACIWQAASPSVLADHLEMMPAGADAAPPLAQRWWTRDPAFADRVLPGDSLPDAGGFLRMLVP